VRVELLAGNPARARSAVVRRGGRVESSYGRVIEALVPAASLARLAHSSGVRVVRAPARPVPESVRGQGVTWTGASLWHKAGAGGAGVKVAIVDLGFGGLRRSQDAGDLPRSAVRVNFCGSGGFEATDHGTAVAEIVAEVAPDAKLYLICIHDLTALARAVAYAQAHGIQIVNHSVSWFNTSRGDGSGGPETPEGIVAAARAAGILWVNAAGNRAQQHWSGTLVDADANGWNEFAPGDEGNTIVVRGGGVACAALKWDDWPASAEDYDLYVTRTDGGAIAALSANPQTGSEPPAELTCLVNDSTATRSYAIAIRAQHVTARPARFDLFVYPGPDLQYQVAAGSVTEPGASPSALTVGAACWKSTALEGYSSQGPTVDGRLKPDLVGPDSVSSYTFGPFFGCGSSGFAGTSAASPHVAAAAALVKQANPSFGPEEIQAYLEQNAVDLGAPGKDPAYGSGRLMLGAAPRLALRACVVPAVVGRRLAIARRRIEEAGCRVGRVRSAKARTRAGRVAAQSPRPGLRLVPRGRVNVTVSRGRR
jgi:subtilisin family serine protease